MSNRVGGGGAEISAGQHQTAVTRRALCRHFYIQANLSLMAERLSPVGMNDRKIGPKSRKGIAMQINIRSAVLIFTLLLFAACSTAQPPADRLTSELEKVVLEEMKAADIPGA